jgi:hypothetical protein
VQSFIALLDKPSLPEVILQIMAWLLGEYAYLVPSLDAADVVDYVLDIMERAKTTTTRIWGVSALTKLIAQLGRVPEQVDEVLQVEERQLAPSPAQRALPGLRPRRPSCSPQLQLHSCNRHCVPAGRRRDRLELLRGSSCRICAATEALARHIPPAAVVRGARTRAAAAADEARAARRRVGGGHCSRRRPALP